VPLCWTRDQTDADLLQNLKDSINFDKLNEHKKSLRFLRHYRFHVSSVFCEKRLLTQWLQMDSDGGIPAEMTRLVVRATEDESPDD